MQCGAILRDMLSVSSYWTDRASLHFLSNIVLVLMNGFGIISDLLPIRPFYRPSKGPNKTSHSLLQSVTSDGKPSERKCEAG